MQSTVIIPIDVKVTVLENTVHRIGGDDVVGYDCYPEVSIDGMDFSLDDLPAIVREIIEETAIDAAKEKGNWE